MNDFLQELGATAPQTAALLSRSALIGFSAFVLVGLWTLWLCGVEVVQNARLTLVQRLGRARPSLRRARAAQAGDEIERAFLILSRLLKRDPGDYQASLAMWQVARDAGHPERAEQALLAVIRQELKRGDEARGVEHWLELLESGYEIGVEPELLLRLAGLLRASGQGPACAATLRGALDAAGDAETLAALARACADFDRETSEEAAWRALGRADLAPDARASLVALLARLYPKEARRAELLLLESHAGGEPAGEPRRAAGRRPAPVRDPEPWVDAELGAGEGERAARVLEALPLEFDGTTLRVEVPEIGRKRVRFASVDALSVASLRGLGPEPVVAIDLLLNWTSSPDEPLRIVRLRSDHFDPRRFAREAASGMEALRIFLRELLMRTGATPLPDRRSALGQPFAAFAGLGLYQSEVLGVGQVETGPA